MSIKTRALQFLGVCLLAAPLAAAPPAAQAQDDFTGSWRSTMADQMHMRQDGDHVSGDYSLRDGRIEGRADGDRLQGTWSQSMSERRCHERRMGTHYWGRFYFHLSGDGDSFRGRWSYCDEDRGSGGEWSGERRHGRDHFDHHDDGDHHPDDGYDHRRPDWRH